MPTALPHRPPVVPPRARRLRPLERARLAAEILACYTAARWWLLRLDFPAAVAAARAVVPRALAEPDASTDAGFRLGQAVERTLRPLPFDSRCLIKALVLTRLLARRGIDSSFVLGVRVEPRFAAHAWVEREGRALLPTSSAFHRLAEL